MIDLSQYAFVAVVVLLTAFNPSPLVSGEAGGEKNIRSVDFRNFTYPISGGGAEIVKAKSIRVRDGKYERRWNDAVASDESFSFSVESVSYGDIDGNGKEEAVVDASLSWMGGVQQ